MTNYPNIIEIFKTIPLFLDLKEFQLFRLAEISSIVEFDPDTKIVQEGGQLDYVYIIIEGEISVSILVPTRGQVETSHLGPLDILGWSALTPVVRQRTGTATSISHVIAVRMDGKKLISLCELDHDIGVVVYRRIANVAARNFLVSRLQMMNIIVHDSQSKT